MTPEEWICIYDIVDVLGVYKDLTTLLQSRTEPAIVYLLPQILRLNVKYLMSPSRMSERFSGRKKEDLLRNLQQVV